MGFIIRDFQSEQIVRHAFHGFAYDKTCNRIICNFSLGEHDSKLLDKKLGRKLSHEEYIRITTKYNESTLGEKKNTISLFQFTRGDILTIKGSYAFELKIVSVNKYKFICLSDNSEVLHCGDVLTLLEMGICKGKQSLFSVVHKGSRFPDEQHVYQTPIIESLFLLKNAHLEDDNVYYPVSVKTYQNVYAYCFIEDYCPCERLTDDEGAAIKIDLANMEYSFNEDIRKDIYNGARINIVDNVLKPIALVEGCDINVVKGIRPGRIRYENNALRIVKRMEIKIGE